ncbi:MAG: DUF2164 domain-containing protein [Leptolyngbyaceae cyanobacterium SM1_1_3]|nr:DUF2164 domain-containing protein [Leptolyngbyaceae cyanobacterium SM1_1_3]NJN01282.1 DUF2164 domain-containing protein [Leptolyngbyaceae cyanobacterium RM1_1_2]NJO10872.1 DUF2164 domain-containing protein [Leptolyngbyaceae cyanobacterium SL_1_1]
MNPRKSQSPVHIKLSQEQQEQLISSIRTHFETALDQEISYFHAKSLMTFFMAELGPLVYNQAVQDAHQFMQDKLGDLESTLYEPETL